MSVCGTSYEAQVIWSQDHKEPPAPTLLSDKFVVVYCHTWLVTFIKCTKSIICTIWPYRVHILVRIANPKVVNMDRNKCQFSEYSKTYSNKSKLSAYKNKQKDVFCTILLHFVIENDCYLS